MSKKTASNPRLTAELADLVRQMAEVAAKPQEQEPENDLDYLLWEAQHDISPAEWWESLLESKAGKERADAEKAYQSLVEAGCSPAALLEALWEIEEAARSGGQPRELLLKDRRKKLEARDSLTEVALDVSRSDQDRKVVLAAWLVLHREADRAAKLAADAKRDPGADKKQRVYQLANLVARRTGQPHYGKLLPLLVIVGDPWKEPALRTMVSRFAASSGERLRKRGAPSRTEATRKPRGRPRKGETLRLRRRPLPPDWDEESDESEE